MRLEDSTVPDILSNLKLAGAVDNLLKSIPPRPHAMENGRKAQDRGRARRHFLECVSL